MGLRRKHSGDRRTCWKFLRMVDGCFAEGLKYDASLVQAGVTICLKEYCKHVAGPILKFNTQQIWI